MARIFISYSRTDEAFARRLARSLSERGEDIWIDVEDIPAGMNWSSAIQQGLLICDVMLVIISPDSMASANVADEWQYYHDQRKPIVPVLWKPADIHYQLKRIQYIDFHTQDYERALAQLHNAIQNRGVPLVSTPPPAPAPAPRERRLEAAMPQQTRLATSTEVWVKIVLPSSVGLRGELPAVVASGDVIHKGDVRGSTFPIEFPLDEGTGRLLPVNLCVKVAAPDFRVRAETDAGGECDEGQVALELHPDYDTRTVVFELIPAPQQQTGRVRVTVSLYHEDRLVAQTAVSTELVESVQQLAGGTAWNLLTLPLLLAAASAPGFAAPDDTTLVGTRTLPMPPSAAMPARTRKSISPIWISGAAMIALVVLGGLLLVRWANEPMAATGMTQTAQAIVVVTNGSGETASATPAPTATFTARALYEQGIALYESENYDDAIAVFSRAIELDPDYADSHRGLGDAYYALEQYEDALASYRRYLELETESPDETVLERVQALEARLTPTPS
jgi:TolA-binding protein